MIYKVSRYGWLPDLPDQRDHFYAALPEAIVPVPAIIDLRTQCPPVYHQGQIGTAANLASDFWTIRIVA